MYFFLAMCKIEHHANKVCYSLLAALSNIQHKNQILKGDKTYGCTQV